MPVKKALTFSRKSHYTICMSGYDELFKHITSEFPRALAALALKTSEVEVGERVSTEQATVRVHRSDMTFHIQLPDEAAILHIEAQTDDSRHKPNPTLEAIMQESPFYEHVIQRGIEQGELRAKRDAVLKLLQRQLGHIPPPFANRINAIQQLSQLDVLFEQALVAKSLDEIDWESTNT